MNNDHKCEQKEDDYFVIQKFLKNIGEKLTTDTTSLRSTHQLYEEARAAHKENSRTALPDYEQVKSQLKKKRRQAHKIPTYSSAQEIDVKDKLTNDNQLFNFLV